MSETTLESIKQRINEFKTARGHERMYTGYASWVNWLADLEWLVAKLEPVGAIADFVTEIKSQPSLDKTLIAAKGVLRDEPVPSAANAKTVKLSKAQRTVLERIADTGYINVDDPMLRIGRGSGLGKTLIALEKKGYIVQRDFRSYKLTISGADALR